MTAPRQSGSLDIGNPSGRPIESLGQAARRRTGAWRMSRAACLAAGFWHGGMRRARLACLRRMASSRSKGRLVAASTMTLVYLFVSMPSHSCAPEQAHSAGSAGPPCYDVDC